MSFVSARCPELAYKIWLRAKGLSREAMDLQESMEEIEAASKSDLEISQNELARYDGMLTDLTNKESLKAKEIADLAGKEIDAQMEVEEAKNKLAQIQSLLKEARSEEARNKTAITDIKVAMN